MTYARKTVDEFRIMGYFEQGWEEVTAEETWKDAKVQVRCYRDNDPDHAYKVVVARVPK